ncbi:MAG: tRNA pseudouridine(13) synthase TruD, partial [Nanoarchaeota archaeon]
EIGKHILRKEFQKAAALIGDKDIKNHLTEKPNDAVGALKKLPIRLLRLYVNAYQSYLWNETLARYLKIKNTSFREVEYSLGKLVFINSPEKFSNLKILLVGFGGEDLIPDKELKEIVTKLLQEEKLTYADFIIKQIPELTLEGELRNAFVEIRSLKVGKLETDELNAGKSKVKVNFTLGKGSYATMAIRAMVNLGQ